MVKEQRKMLRIPASIVVEFQAEEAELWKGRGCLTDLSAGGFGVETESAFPLETEMRFTFHLPVSVRGKVVRIDRRGALKKYGIRFTRMEKVEKLQIEKYISEKFKK